MEASELMIHTIQFFYTIGDDYRWPPCHAKCHEYFRRESQERTAFNLLLLQNVTIIIIKVIRKIPFKVLDDAFRIPLPDFTSG